MQTTLLGLALALIAAILAAFAAPFFIDWNEWRPELEMQASALAGSRVTISGKIDLTLLPTPAFVLRNVSVGDAESGIGMRASEMRGSLSLTALLSGKIEASEFVVSRPAIRLVIEKDGKFLLPAGVSAGQEISVSGFVFETGSLTVEDRRTKSIFVADDFSARGELVSREGPFRLEGNFRANGVRWILRAFSGRFDAEHKGKVRIALERPSDDASFEAEGLLTLANAAPRFEGKITAARRSGQLPWRIASDALGDVSEVRFNNLELALGQGELPITLSGEAKLTPNANGTLEVSLSSKRVDLDLGDPKAATTGAAHVLPWLSEAQKLLTSFPLPARLSISADGVLAGGQLARDVRVALRAANGLVEVQQLEARLPGRAAITLSGKTEPDRFSGPLFFESEEPQIFTRWLLGEELSTKFSLAAGLHVKGELSFVQNEIALRGIDAEFGAAKLRGDAVLRQTKDAKQALELKLAVENADLDPLLPFLRATPDWDGLNFTAELTAVRSRLLGTDLKMANVSVVNAGTGTAITRLSIADLDGFSLEAKQPQPDKGEFEFSVSVRRADGLIRVLQYLSESRDFSAIAAKYLASHFPLQLSGLLSPIKNGRRLLLKSEDASFALDFGALRDGRLPIDAVLRLPETEVSATGDLRFGKDGRFEPVLALKLKSSDLRKASVLADRAYANVLVASASVALSRDGNNLVFDKLIFDLAGTRGQGKIAIPAGEVSPFSGQISLDRADAATLLSLALGRAHVSYVELGVPLLANFPGALKLDIEQLALSDRISMQKVVVNIRSGRYETVFEDFHGLLAGGKVSGSLRVADTFPRVLEIKLDAAGVALAQLFAAKNFRGAMLGTLTLSANGNTQDALIASLSGQGKIGLANIEIDQADATAVATVYAASTRSAPEEAKIEEMLLAALARGPLKVSKLDAPLVIANGIIRSGSATAAAGNTVIALSGSFDVPKRSVDVLLNIEARIDSSVRPGAMLRWTGPWETPERKVDARALITAVTLRAIERGQNPSNINLPKEDRPAEKKKRTPAKSDVETAPLLPPPANIPASPQPRSQN